MPNLQERYSAYESDYFERGSKTQKKNIEKPFQVI